MIVCELVSFMKNLNLASPLQEFLKTEDLCF